MTEEEGSHKGKKYVTIGFLVCIAGGLVLGWFGIEGILIGPAWAETYYWILVITAGVTILISILGFFVKKIGVPVCFVIGIGGLIVSAIIAGFQWYSIGFALIVVGSFIAYIGWRKDKA